MPYVAVCMYIWADAPLLRPHLAVCGSALASPAPGGESFSRRPQWPGCPPGYAALQHPACPARPYPAHLPAVAGNPDQTEYYRGGKKRSTSEDKLFTLVLVVFDDIKPVIGKIQRNSGEREVMVTEISWKLTICWVMGENSRGTRGVRGGMRKRQSEEKEGQKGRKRLLSLRLEKIRKQLVGLVLSHEYHFSLRMYSKAWTSPY